MSVRRVQVQREFERQIDAWVIHALQHRALTFTRLLTRLPGVFPSAALDSVHRLAQLGQIEGELAERLERQAALPRRLNRSAFSHLPPPHPLDFEWRFTRSTGRDLLRRAKALAGKQATVLLFGTPALAATAAEYSNGSPIIFLADDNRVTESVAVLNHGAGEPLTIRICDGHNFVRGEAAVVVLDPPWYADFVRPMLAAAAYSCQTGGYIFISLPPAGTRATALQDRLNLMRLCRRLSLQVVEEEHLALTYETPFFEANALAAAGMPGIPAAWRHGDLVLIRKMADSPRPVMINPQRKQAWRELTIVRMRVVVRTGVVSDAKPFRTLNSIVPGDILPVVSRRDARRRRAQVWTSGNRIFASERTDLVVAAANGGPSARRSHFLGERDEVERLRYALHELAAVEEAEEMGGHRSEASWRWAFTSDSANLSGGLEITASG
jgi:hypothetical protein